MKRFLTLLVVSLAFSVAWARQSQQVYYQKSDSTEIVNWMKEASRQPSGTNVQLFLARKFLGRPYVAYTLEILDDERLIENTREVDCTTFVETVVAMTLCVKQGKMSFLDYTDMHRSLRYRNGRIDRYPSRIHYFTEWIDTKQAMGLVKEVQAPNPPFRAVQTVHVDYMTTHWQAYKHLKAHPEYVPEITRMEQSLSGRQYRYIPQAALNNTKLLRDAIHDGDILALTSTKQGLDIAHLGFAVWQQDGLHMLHASSVKKKVILDNVPLRQYLYNNKDRDGVRVVRIIK